MIVRSRIALGILAGGRGSRLGGVDKAWCVYDGHSLLERTVDALGSGFAECLISHPCADPRFQAMGLRQVPDLRPGQRGPLAGLESLLAHTGAPWLLTVPVDLRELPGDACERLAAGGGSGAVAVDEDGRQPLLALWPVAPGLRLVRAALDVGAGAVHPLLDELGMASVRFPGLRFGNLNTPEDFRG